MYVSQPVSYTHLDVYKRQHTEEYLYTKNIHFITYEDNYYPAALHNIYAPPAILFYKGRNLIQNNPICISIVGSRKCTDYGQKAARMFSSKLASGDLCIVSGLALGIDAQAHLGALDVGGTTIGVLGCGADVVYPSANKYLHDRIIEEGGMILSEFTPMTPPLAQNFPRRNRIISGIAFGTIVVEASKNSGSLKTARYALEQGKNVYAVPGQIFSEQSEGANNLIKEGAKLVTDVDDIYFDLKVYLRPLKENKNRIYPLSNEPMTEEEEIILTAIREGFQTPDAISKRIGRPVSHINRTITLDVYKRQQ